jgi:hypothetical protein
MSGPLTRYPSEAGTAKEYHVPGYQLQMKNRLGSILQGKCQANSGNRTFGRFEVEFNCVACRCSPVYVTRRPENENWDPCLMDNDGVGIGPLHRFGIGVYTSVTKRKGNLGHGDPDRRFFLLGEKITP